MTITLKPDDYRPDIHPDQEADQLGHNLMDAALGNSETGEDQTVVHEGLMIAGAICLAVHELRQIKLLLKARTLAKYGDIYNIKDEIS